LGGIPLSTKVDFTRDVISAGGRAIDFGVVAQTTRTREKTGTNGVITQQEESKSTHYSKLQILSSETSSSQPVFAARVRTGYYSNGHQIKVQGVTEALAAISKTIKS
jgi:hypothetical protein